MQEMVFRVKGHHERHGISVLKGHRARHGFQGSTGHHVGHGFPVLKGHRVRHGFQGSKVIVQGMVLRGLNVTFLGMVFPSQRSSSKEWLSGVQWSPCWTSYPGRKVILLALVITD